MRRTLIALGTLMVMLGAVTIAANASASDICGALDSGKVDVSGDIGSVTVTAPPGYLIDEYCVKAGSSYQGLGPEYVPVDPPQATIVITPSSGKDISHWSVGYTMPTTTTTHPTSTTSTTTVHPTSTTSTTTVHPTSTTSTTMVHPTSTTTTRPPAGPTSTTTTVPPPTSTTTTQPPPGSTTTTVTSTSTTTTQPPAGPTSTTTTVPPPTSTTTTEGTTTTSEPPLATTITKPPTTPPTTLPETGIPARLQSFGFVGGGLLAVGLLLLAVAALIGERRMAAAAASGTEIWVPLRPPSEFTIDIRLHRLAEE